MKLKVDMPLSAAKIKDDTYFKGVRESYFQSFNFSILLYPRLMSSISFYLHLPPSISFKSESILAKIK